MPHGASNVARDRRPVPRVGTARGAELHVAERVQMVDDVARAELVGAVARRALGRRQRIPRGEPDAMAHLPADADIHAIVVAPAVADVDREARRAERAVWRQQHRIVPWSRRIAVALVQRGPPAKVLTVGMNVIDVDRRHRVELMRPAHRRLIRVRLLDAR